MDPFDEILRKRVVAFIDGAFEKIEAKIRLKYQRHKAARAFADVVVRSWGKVRQFPDVKTNLSIRRVYSHLRVTQDVPSGPNGHEGGRGMDPVHAIALSDGGFALRGRAGTGKSTILRWLAVRSAQGRTLRGARRVPFFIPAPELVANQRTIREQGEEILRTARVDQPKEVFEHLLGEGDACLIVDGLDEVSSSHRILEELHSLRAGYDRSLYITGGRPGSPVGTQDQWQPMPVARDVRRVFVTKWFDARNEDSSVRDSLIKDLSQANASVASLSGDPLLLGLLCHHAAKDLFKGGKDIHVFEDSCKGLLGGWDEWREKYEGRTLRRDSFLSRLDLVQRLQISALIAWQLLSHERMVFSTSDLSVLAVDELVSEVLRASVSPSMITEALHNDFGLLTRYGQDSFSFTHVRLHHFLAAYHAHRGGRLDTTELVSRMRDPAWHDVIGFGVKLAGLDDSLLRALHHSADLQSATELGLLVRVWRDQPHLTAPGLDEVLPHLVSRLKWDLRQLADEGCSLVFTNAKIVVRSRTDNHMATSAGELLPLVATLLRTIGCPPDSLPGDVPRELREWIGGQPV